MKCPSCGKNITESARFCGYCGAAQAPRPSTGHKLFQRPFMVGAVVVLLALVVVTFLLLWTPGTLSGPENGSPEPGTATRDIDRTIPAIEAPPEFDETKPPELTPPAGIALPANLEEISSKNAQQLVELTSWRLDKVNSITFAPTDDKLAIATEAGIYLYDVGNLEELRFIESAAPINSVSFVPDGRVLAASSDDNKVHLWQAMDGALLRTIGGFDGAVKSVDFSLNGRVLISGSADGFLRFWNTADGTLVDDIDVSRGQAMDHEIRQVEYSPDGQYVAIAPSLDEFDIELQHTGEGIGMAFWVNDAPVSSFAFSADGTFLAAGYENGALRLWPVDGTNRTTKEAAIAQILKEKYLPENTEAYSWTAFRSADDQFLLILKGEDGTILVARPDEPIRALQLEVDVAGELDEDGIPTSIEGYERLNRLTVVRYIDQLANIVFGFGDLTVQIGALDIAGAFEQRYTHDAQQDVFVDEQSGELFEPINGVFVSSSGEKLWPGFAASETVFDSQQEEAINCLAYSPDGLLLAAGTSRGVHLLGAQDLEELILIPEIAPVSTLAFSGNGHLLVTGSEDGDIHLWGITN